MLYRKRQINVLFKGNDDYKSILISIRKYFRYILNTHVNEINRKKNNKIKFIDSYELYSIVRRVLNYRAVIGIPLDKYSYKLYMNSNKQLCFVHSILSQSRIIPFNETGLVKLRTEKREKFDFLRNALLCAICLIDLNWMSRVTQEKYDVVIKIYAIIRKVINIEFDYLVNSNDIKPVFALSGKKSYTIRSEITPQKNILIMQLTNKYLNYYVINNDLLPKSLNELIFEIGEFIIVFYRKLMRGKNISHAYFLETKQKIYNDFSKLIMDEISIGLYKKMKNDKNNSHKKYKIIQLEPNKEINQQLFQHNHVVICDGYLYYMKLNFNSKSINSFQVIDKYELKNFLNRFEYKNINCVDIEKISKLLDNNIKRLIKNPYYIFPVAAQKVYFASETYYEIMKSIKGFIHKLELHLYDSSLNLQENKFFPRLENNLFKLKKVLNIDT